MTNCCRKCSKIFCYNRDKTENCKDCISYVYIAIQKIDNKIKDQKEKKYDRI